MSNGSWVQDPTTDIEQRPSRGMYFRNNRLVGRDLKSEVGSEAF